VHDDRAALEDRIARAIDRIQSDRRVAKRDRGLQQLYEQALSDGEATPEQARHEGGRFTIRADPTQAPVKSRRSS